MSFNSTYQHGRSLITAPIMGFGGGTPSGPWATPQSAKLSFPPSGSSLTQDNEEIEKNGKVQVLASPPALPPEQLRHLAKTNPDASWIDDPDKFPLNFAKGFHSIADCLSTIGHNNIDPFRYAARVNLLNGDPTPMRDLTDLYEHHVNGPVMDIRLVVELLEQEGFVLLSTFTNALEYAKFTDKNLPMMTVSVCRKSRRNEHLVRGAVTSGFYDKIKKILAPQMALRPKSVSIQELTGYRTHDGEFCGGDFKSTRLTEGMDYALQSFYPWFGVSIDAYFKEFLSSRANVLVLIGPPGTGKSTLIRTMIRDLNVNALLAYKPDVITSGYFMKVCREFLQYSSETETTDVDGNVIDRPCAVVVEDADAIMAARRLGNMQMSEILNATSGIASDTNSKFILSTNLKDTDEIDPALLRPGRCFDILCFRELTAPEAVVIREARGLEPREFDPGRRYKLAEVLNNVSTQNLNEPVIKPRFGFQK